MTLNKRKMDFLLHIVTLFLLHCSLYLILESVSLKEYWHCQRINLKSIFHRIFSVLLLDIFIIGFPSNFQWKIFLNFIKCEMDFVLGVFVILLSSNLFMYSSANSKFSFTYLFLEEFLLWFLHAENLLLISGYELKGSQDS